MKQPEKYRALLFVPRTKPLKFGSLITCGLRAPVLISARHRKSRMTRSGNYYMRIAALTNN